MIKRILLKIFESVMSLFPPKYILMESIPDYSDNTLAVYNYLIRNRNRKKYKLIWVAKKSNPKIPNIVLKNSILSRLKYKYYSARAKVLVYCNGVIPKKNEKQISFFLCHGSKSKMTRGSYEAPKDLDYILVQADMFREATKYGYNLSERTQMVTLGYPRNDDLLTEHNIDRRKLFGKDFEKLIVWYPTFRQHWNGKKNVSSITLPVIHDETAACTINEKAKELGVLIALKPHFVQDVSYIKNQEFSNIVIINDDFLSEKNIRSYQLLSVCDSLLTDYSSVYYDYLLCNKPIGLVWEDYEEYKAEQGFALDPNVVYSGGEKIFNVEDFCAYLERIAKGEDILKEERTKIKNLSNVYQDANSSKRVAEFIIDLIESN